MKPANRIASLKPYFFANLGARIAAQKAEGKDVIRMDMGSPDLPPADFIIDTLTTAVRDPSAHSYTPYGGTPAYRQAVAAYYHNRFGVSLDPKTEVVGLIGSKEGLFVTSQVLLDPGDLALVPDPAYNTYAAGAELAGGVVYPMPLLAENDFLPDLQAIPARVLAAAKILWLNYPNNPTGAIAPRAFLEEAVAFARRHGLIIAHDTPYTEICYNGYTAPSLLEIPSAKEVAVEFNSLSKTYNMAGWRLGMAVGNADVIRYIDTYKSQADSSHFGPVLLAGATALTGDQSWLAARNAIYQERRDTVITCLNEIGLPTPAPKAALYVWVRLPEGENDAEFCARMLEEIAVSATPGSIYGEHGAGYMRLSLCIPVSRIREAFDRLAIWMKTSGRACRDL